MASAAIAGPSGTGPPVFLIPADATDLSRNLQNDERHFISAREFSDWSKSHPSVRPDVPTASTSGTATPKQLPPPSQQQTRAHTTASTYTAPQHPTSHILKTIPPRAPSRSTKSNILSYTVHLSTSTLLKSYRSLASPLLHLAEAATNSGSACDSDIDELSTFFASARDEYDKAGGIQKLSRSLLRENRRQGELPASVERRVELAHLVQKLLAEALLPAGDEAKGAPVVPISTDDVKPLSVLVPLASPVSILAGSTAATSHKRIAQSLLDAKFGAAEDEPREPAPEVRTTSSTSKPIALPHMDYRIVRGQAMRSRAKIIYGNSVLNGTPVAQRWCRRHRVKTCVVCTSSLSLPPKSSLPTPSVLGSGLLSTSPEDTRGRPLPLASLIPDFLLLSASLLNDLRERADASDSLLESLEFTTFAVADGPGGPEADKIDVTAGWYALVHELVVQSVLEGYLVDGWEGTGGLEILFGLGCGVWEGRTWLPAPPVSSPGAFAAAGARGRRMSIDEQMVHEPLVAAASDSSSEEGDDDDSDDDEEEAEEGERERERLEQEHEQGRLLRAAQTLFGSRDIAQADYERSMKDRAHEFLDVPESKTLVEHLSELSIKYPLSALQDLMIDFAEATNKLLGFPALARYEADPDVPTKPDVYALARFFARPELDQLDVGMTLDTRADLRQGKKRRVD